MKKLTFALLSLFGLHANTACSQQKNYEDADVKVFSEIITQPEVILLDVRTAQEFSEGHIDGARNIDVKQDGFLEAAKKALSTDKTIAVYCRSGRRSANAAEQLSANGYKVVNLLGGYLAWQKEKPNVQAPLKKVYDETINPLTQIDEAVTKAKGEGKFVVCQVGGNWCPWCLRFADFIAKDAEISQLIADNFVYIHVNYNPRKSAGAEQAEQAKQLMARLNQPARFGFPVFVVLNADGQVIHIQDSSFLEEGKGYSKEKVIRFFKNWTPAQYAGQ